MSLLIVNLLVFFGVWGRMVIFLVSDFVCFFEMFFLFKIMESDWWEIMWVMVFKSVDLLYLLELIIVVIFLSGMLMFKFFIIRCLL